MEQTDEVKENCVTDYCTLQVTLVFQEKGGSREELFKLANYLNPAMLSNGIARRRALREEEPQAFEGEEAVLAQSVSFRIRAQAEEYPDSFPVSDKLREKSDTQEAAGDSSTSYLPLLAALPVFAFALLFSIRHRKLRRFASKTLRAPSKGVRIVPET